jgi:molybdopterin molybdotransferase
LATPARLGLLAAAGHALLPVHRRPRIALLSTGDELVPPGGPLAPGQIIASNGLAVAALLRAHGADVDDLGIAPDRLDALAAAITRARGHDILVTIGGASVGDHDLVKPALEAAGAQLDFWKVALRPGKPLMAGRLGAQLVAGLPGNPVSAFVCARLFLVPLLRRLAGNPAPRDTPEAARTTAPLAANGPRRDFMRAHLAPGPSGWAVTAAAAQDSSLASVLAGANALLIRPERGPALPIGAEVPVLRL